MKFVQLTDGTFINPDRVSCICVGEIERNQKAKRWYATFQFSDECSRELWFETWGEAQGEIGLFLAKCKDFEEIDEVKLQRLADRLGNIISNSIDSYP